MDIDLRGFSVDIAFFQLGTESFVECKQAVKKPKTQTPFVATGSCQILLVVCIYYLLRNFSTSFFNLVAQAVNLYIE
jgi:hypothetical protein